MKVLILKPVVIGDVGGVAVTVMSLIVLNGLMYVGIHMFAIMRVRK